jgi:toxin CcdB
MARFDVFRSSGRHPGTPYVVDVQGNHLSGLATRVVVPLRRLDQIAPVPLPPDLIPVFVIEGIECMLDTPTLAAIPRGELATPITSLGHRQDEIMSALDRLFGAW